MEFFIIRDEKRRDYCIDFIRNIPFIPTLSVEIKRYVKKRSLAQNRFYWAILGEIAQEHHGSMEEKDAIHEDLLGSIWGWKERSYKINGRTYTRPVPMKRSKDLNTRDFGILIDAAEMLARELNIRVSRPDDYDFLRSYEL